MLKACNRDITDKLRKYFSGHLVAPNKKLCSKFWFRAAKCPVNVQKMLNVCFRATICTEKYLRDLSVMSLIDTDRDITDKTAENFSGHLVAPDHEFGGIFARPVHLKLPEKFSGHFVVSFSREASSNT